MTSPLLRCASFCFVAVVASNLLAQMNAKPPTDNFDRRIKLIAGRAAVGQTLNKLAERTEGDANHTKHLAQQMLANPGEHRSDTPDKSRRLLAEEIRRQLAADHAKILAGRGLKLHEIQQIWPDFEAAVNSAVSKHLDRVADDQNTAARKSAVADQHKALALRVRLPDQGQVDELMPTWSTSRPELHARLVRDATPPKIVLFAENEKLVSEHATKLLDNIELEFKQQQQTLERAAADDELTKGSLTSDKLLSLLVGQLDQLARRTDRPIPSYGVFPSLRKQAVDMSEKLEAERFERHVRSADISLADELIRQTIEADVTSHRDARSSADLLAKKFREPVARDVARGYVEASKEMNAEPYFVEQLQQPQFAAPLANRLQDLLRTKTPGLRQKIAESQRNASFAAVAQWTPKEDVIVESYKSGRSPRTLAEALELWGTAPGGKGPWLEETEQLVVAGVAERLAAGVSALRGQLSLLESRIKTEEAQLKAEVLMGRPKQKLVAEWQERLRADWTNNAESKQFPLFEYSLTRTAQQVSVHFDSILKQAEDERVAKAAAAKNAAERATMQADAERLARETAPKAARDLAVPAMRDVADAKSAGTTLGVSGGVPFGGGLIPGGFGPGTNMGPGGNGGGGNKDGERGGAGGQGEGRPDLTLVLSDTSNGRCVAKLGGETLLTFSPQEIEGTVRQLADRLNPRLAELAVQKSAQTLEPKGPQPSIRFHLQVRSAEIRSLMSITLRKELERAIQQLPPDRKVPLTFSDGV